MPHCVVEYSRNLEKVISVLNVMEEVKASSIRSGLFSPDDVKVRALAYDQFLVAGKEEDFIHVTLKILSGRTAEQKESLSGLVLSGLQELALNKTLLTVEVCDIDKASYQKVLTSS